MGYQKIIKISKKSQQNNSETVTNKNDKEIPKERYIAPEEKRLIMEYQKIINLLDNTTNPPTKFRTKH